MKSSLLCWTILTLLISSSTAIIKLPKRQRQLATISSMFSTSSNTTGTSSATYCNQEMMTSYGLKGNSKPVSSTHAMCPSISQNCCTADDAAYSLELWNTDARKRVERYYEIYLYIIKYILGYSAEAYSLAQDYQNSTVSSCKTAATDTMSMNMNLKVTKEIYNAFVVSMQKMSDIRRGFYCILCDARTQSRLADYYSVINVVYSDRIYFSQSFCRTLVDNTIQASYYVVNYLKRFSENMVTLMNCKSGSTDKPTYDLAFFTRQQVKNCFFFKSKYFFFFCENYCEKFHLTRASDILDGDLVQLKKFFDHIAKYRKEVFYHPTNNVLMDGLSYEETYVKENFPDMTGDYIFFRAGSSQQIQLEKFKTDVVYYGGMDPWVSCTNSKYLVVLTSASIFKAFIALLVLFTV